MVAASFPSGFSVDDVLTPSSFDDKSLISAFLLFSLLYFSRKFNCPKTAPRTSLMVLTECMWHFQATFDLYHGGGIIAILFFSQQGWYAFVRCWQKFDFSFSVIPITFFFSQVQLPQSCPWNIIDGPH